MTELERVSHETMVFMRGKYRLDEMGDGKDALTLRPSLPCTPERIGLTS